MRLISSILKQSADNISKDVKEIQRFFHVFFSKKHMFLGMISLEHLCIAIFRLTLEH